MSNPRPLPLSIERGQYSGGDAALIPEGYARRLRNLAWADVWDSRPPFTYDNIANVRGLGVWHDQTNDVARLVATQLGNALFVKATSGETFPASVGNAGNSSVLDQVTFRGRWLMLRTQSGSDLGTPRGLTAYDGVTLDASADVSDEFPQYFFPYSLTIFRDRVFYGGAQHRGFVWADPSEVVLAYDPSTWTATSVSTSAIASDGTTLYRITPTATSGAEIYHGDEYTPHSSGDRESSIQFQCQLRGVDDSYRMPITVSIRYATARQNSIAYEAGNIVVPATPNGYRYRCTVAGTSDVAPPVYPTTVGTTVADGTATWVCDGSSTAAQTEFYLPSASQSRDWTFRSLVARVPNNANTNYDFVIAFGTTATPTITLAPVDFGYNDGRAVTDPRKQNYGQGRRVDGFEGPLFSGNFASDSITIDHGDYIYWSEVGAPLRIRAQNTYRVADVPGNITAVRAVGDYLVAAKRTARWVFASSEDSRYVILPVGGVRRGAGILNPKAADVCDHDGMLYYVSENGVYRWDVRGESEELCGERMLREMFNKSASTWCEFQTAPANRALLTIDQKNKRVLVYVQKGKIHVYDIRREAWSVWSAGSTAENDVGYQICDMIYNPGTGNVYVAFTEAATGTAGLARLDDTQAAAEDQISSSGTLPVTFEIIPRALEGRPRVDMEVDEINAYVDCTVAGQEATTYVSFDQGSTWEVTDPARDLLTTEANYEPERFGIWSAWGTMLPRIVVTGKAGPGALKISSMDATVRTNKLPEFPKTAP